METWLWLLFGILVTILVGMLFSRRRSADEDERDDDEDLVSGAAGAESAKAKAGSAKSLAAKTAAKPATEHAIKTAETTDKSKQKADAAIPALSYEEDEDIDPTKLGEAAVKGPRSLQPPTKKIVYDDDAASDEPTRSAALILVTAQAQTDKGLRRKRNEDSILAMPDEGVFVVADGMGGYKGGEIASALAVKTIENAFRTNAFAAEPHDNLPARASELARAIQMANEAILEKAQSDKQLTGMGTTICAVRFALNKQRLYVGHVGDSRLYRVREGKLHRMTSDHTMGDLGLTGPQAAHLSRAVGIWPTVAIDIVLGTPQPGDVYLLCSDGLTKMAPDDQLEPLAVATPEPTVLVERLIDLANANGGKDNISVIAVRVLSATGEG